MDDDQSLVQNYTTASASQQQDAISDGKKMNPNDSQRKASSNSWPDTQLCLFST